MAVQGASLARRQACDEGEVVLRAPLGPALQAPPAHLAVLYGLRRSRRREGRAPSQHCLELVGHEAVVGRIVGDTKGDPLALHPAEREVHLRRRPVLEFTQHVRIHAELQHGRRLGAPGELGVPDLVAPRTKGTGRLDAAEEVGVAQATAVEEERLVDGAGPFTHGRKGGVPSSGYALARGQHLVRLDLADRHPLGTQRL